MALSNQRNENLNQVDQIDRYKQDYLSISNKLSATTEEQRELKRLWLAEKTDLLNRCQHIQNLNTQLQAKLIKQEKDFQKLQNQLAQMMKQNEKKSKTAIVLSSSLAATLSSNSGNSSVKKLIDCQVHALSSSNTFLAKENDSLRAKIESIQKLLQSTKDECSHRMLVLESKLSSNVGEINSTETLVAKETNREASSSDDLHAKLNALTQKLQEAQNVIYEQDRLIREGNKRLKL
jgi:hypothetical protein